MSEFIKPSQNETSPWATANETAPEVAEPVRSPSIAESIVERTRASFDAIVLKNTNAAARTRDSITRLEQKKSAETDEWRSERYAQQIADAKRTLRLQEAQVEFARVPTAEDIEYRTEIKEHFSDAVKEAVPDSLPLVFHGSGNIGQVREIIKTNGLLTPEQRGESMASFATMIDVTAKTNIAVSCEFADSHYHWMPYGAIFAFMPRPEEIEEVNKTGDGSEVFGGVNGVNFQQDPERLFGIITTPENIGRVQSWCEEYGLDKDKVLTHSDFIKTFNNKDQA